MHKRVGRSPDTGKGRLISESERGCFGNLRVDQRDQEFVQHEMFMIEELFGTPHYGHLTKGMFDASLDAAHQLALKEFCPIMAEADREG